MKTFMMPDDPYSSVPRTCRIHNSMFIACYRVGRELYSIIISATCDGTTDVAGSTPAARTMASIDSHLVTIWNSTPVETVRDRNPPAPGERRHATVWKSRCARGDLRCSGRTSRHQERQHRGDNQQRRYISP